MSARHGFAPILIILIVICLLIGAIVLSIFALNNFFQKPLPPTGNDEAIPQTISKLQIIDLKFKNGSTIRLRDGKFVSTSGENLSGLQTILNSVPGIKIERLFSQSEESIANQKKSLESKTNKELPDLNLFYILTLPKEANAQSLVTKLKALSIIEDAYIAPTPAPPPTQTDETVYPEASQSASLLVVKLVKKDLSDLLKIPENSVEVMSVNKAEWMDSCLGVDTGELCAQVITPGYKISLRGTGNRIYIYHTDLNKNFILEPRIRGNL